MATENIEIVIEAVNKATAGLREASNGIKQLNDTTKEATRGISDASGAVGLYLDKLTKGFSATNFAASAAKKTVSTFAGGLQISAISLASAALGALALKLVENVIEINSAQKANEGFKASMDSVKKSVDDARSSLSQWNAEISALISAQAGNAEKLEALIKTTIEAKFAAEARAAAIKEEMININRSQGLTESATMAIEKLGGEYAAAQKDVDGFTKKIDAFNEQMSFLGGFGFAQAMEKDLKDAAMIQEMLGNQIAQTALRQFRERGIEQEALGKFIAQQGLADFEQKKILIQAEGDLQEALGQRIANMGLAQFELQKTLDEQRAANFSGTMGFIANSALAANKKFFVIAKAAGIAQATVDTWVAVNKTLASFPWPLNIALAALVAAAGLSNVAKISSMAPPAMAEGGIVTRPTMALIGEAGPEAVVPLGRAGGMGMPGGSITINFSGPVMGDKQQAREFALMIDRELNDLKTRNLSIAFA